MSIITKIKTALLYPLVYSIISVQSFTARMKILGKKPVVHFEQPYAGQKILLLALYEKGQLRIDIENLLITAKSLGIYVLAVNALKVLQPDSLKDKIDCYIERPNFGRDFGSYKTGFLHLYKKNWEQKCDRLLMLNDSVFYSKATLQSFLERMTTTEIEALGATENHEILWHLGSFCISIDQHIMQHPRFRKFWARYSNTNIRPKVIKRGELHFTRTLNRCVRSSDQIGAYFNVSWLANYLENNQKILYHISDLSRVGLGIAPMTSLKSASDRLIRKYLQIDPSLANTNIGTTIKTDLATKTGYFVDDAYGIINAIEKSVKESKIESLEARVLQEVKYNVIEHFTIGSQIHTNNPLLHHLGMPLIKLDGLYRGSFAIEDVQTLINQLQNDEKMHFSRLIYSRPLGNACLVGWKLVAFQRGLI